MNASTAQKNETTSRTEWGIERTWPDGHVEYKREDSRGDAERIARMVNVAHEDGRNPATAAPVARTVTTTPWTPVN